MAKRKPAPAKGRKTASRRAGAGRTRSRAAGTARTKGARLRKASARQATRKGIRRKGAARQGARLRKASVGPAARKASRRVIRKAPRKVPRKPAPKAVRKVAPTVARQVARKAVRHTTVPRRVPALDRERRVVRDDDVLPSTPSSLDLDRSASSARSGRRELVEKLHQHTESSPALTGGDVDADWESAYAVGDEAPGGDNQTPDQGIADDIGKALGVQYEDNEELKGEKKISDRDKKRWELDPASSDDYDDR